MSQNLSTAAVMIDALRVKVTRSAIMNIFRKFYLIFKLAVKIELSYAFTIKSIQYSCKLHRAVNYPKKSGVFLLLVIICVPLKILDS